MLTTQWCMMVSRFDEPGACKHHCFVGSLAHEVANLLSHVLRKAAIVVARHRRRKWWQQFIATQIQDMTVLELDMHAAHTAEYFWCTCRSYNSVASRGSQFEEAWIICYLRGTLHGIVISACNRVQDMTELESKT
jgi:hypothetical protein